MGRFEISPLFVDLPGGKAGEQVNQLFDTKRWYKYLVRLFIGQKTVWIILLSTVQRTDIDKNHSWEQKLDLAYIEQQLGYLDLPLGILGSKESIKPKMVIACIGKFDLFSDKPPDDSSSEKTKKQVENVFLRHLSRIESECKAQNIPFRKVICSALMGWGVDDINRYISNALF
jgi:hypothetical protein